MEQTNDLNDNNDMGSRRNRVLRLNNDYTNEQLKKQAHLVMPKRRYLGLILITVVIVLTVPTYGLIQSYQTLQESVTINQKTMQQSEQLSYTAESQSIMAKNMKNTYYIEKFARKSPFFYSLPGEKIFTTPNETQGSTTTNAPAGTGQ